MALEIIWITRMISEATSDDKGTYSMIREKVELKKKNNKWGYNP
jgi:hypothetical protein